MAIAMGDGKFDIEVAATAEHQDTLERIAGGRSENGVDHLCGALLVPNPKNPTDPNAIAVVIDSHVIGFVPTPIAPSLKYALRVGEFIAAGCAARITGGWARRDGDIGPFSVRLDAEWPFKLRPIAKETPANPPSFLAPQRPAPPPVPAAPQVEIRPFDDDRVPVEAEEEAMPPRRRVSLLSMLLQVLLAAAILAVGYWWVQRLPRTPVDTPSAASPPAQVVPKTTEPTDQQPASSPFGAPPPAPNAPFQWPDPPNFQTPPASAPPPATTTAPPASAPPQNPPAAKQPPAEKQPAPEKKAKPKAKAPPPNAPLKIN